MSTAVGGVPAPGTRSGSSRRKLIRVGLGLGLLLLVAVVYEATTSRIQSRYFVSLAQQMHFGLEPGRNPSMLKPATGPYDTRLGYSRIEQFTDTLEARGFKVVSQARSSPAMFRWAERGIGPIYPEKTHAGLRILDPSERVLYASRYPMHTYATFDSIPPVLVQTLLFIENRELLQDEHPRRNPAVEWDRLGKAVVEELIQKVNPGRNVAGGSTLATQIEKFRHSPGGFTASPTEKIRQMMSASIRAYRNGPDTRWERRRIFLDYVNSIPLAAAPKHGEVNGLGDGLWAWYGASFKEVNALLATDHPGNAVGTARRGLAYRQALSLMIAQRRPTYYLIQEPAVLAELTDSYLRILYRDGVIDRELRDAALLAEAPIQTPRLQISRVPLVESKTAVSIRSSLTSLLGLQDLYELDRLDLDVVATLDSAAQREVAKFFQQLRDPDFASEAGFLQSRLLQRGDLASVVYSMNLYERTVQGNVLRVQADTFERAVNLNEGARLELGSTAKLRALANYLEIVAVLFYQHSGKPASEIRDLPVHSKDPLSQWVRDYLLANPRATIDQIVEAAMLRHYSASPHEKFFTGGGVHQFANFDSKHDTEIMSVRTGFQNSVNLVFIRLMRDIVHYYIYRGSTTEQFLQSFDDTLRTAYLEKFADREGSVFLRRFHGKYREMAPAQMTTAFFDGVRKTPKALTTAFRSLHPSAGPSELATFLRGRLEDANLKGTQIERIHEDYGPDSFGLEDRGYIAGVHPLELWLVGYRLKHPDADLRQILADSRTERQQVYTWLFRTKRKDAQDVRIRGLLEVEAFLEIQRSWANLGYPFANLVPSYATAIGSSGDRPAALADLMGIILGGGVRSPNVRVIDVEFASGTPYETNLGRTPGVGQQVMDPAVASRLRAELIGVVQSGTARRAFESVRLPDDTVLAVGGKTGTGDNRINVVGAGGQRVSSKVMNRTASFVFLVGDRYFGTIVAFVPGEKAGNFDFTSALPVQIWKVLAPRLQPLFTSAIPAEDAVSTDAGSQATGAGSPGGNGASKSRGVANSVVLEPANAESPMSEPAKVESPMSEPAKVESPVSEPDDADSSLSEPADTEPPVSTPSDTESSAPRPA